MIFLLVFLTVSSLYGHDDKGLIVVKHNDGHYSIAHKDCFGEYVKHTAHITDLSAFESALKQDSAVDVSSVMLMVKLAVADHHNRYCRNKNLPTNPTIGNLVAHFLPQGPPQEQEKTKDSPRTTPRRATRTQRITQPMNPADLAVVMRQTFPELGQKNEPVADRTDDQLLNPELDTNSPLTVRL